MNPSPNATHSHLKPSVGSSPRPALFVSDTAARRLNSSVPTGIPTDDVQTVLTRLRETPFDSVEAVYVLDTARRLLGCVAQGD